MVGAHHSHSTGFFSTRAVPLDPGITEAARGRFAAGAGDSYTQRGLQDPVPHRSPHADRVADDSEYVPAIAWFDLTGSRPELEERGLDMTAAMSLRMRLGIEADLVPAVPAGPHFDYDTGPDLFLGRHGSGPLDVVWDTNVLIDYFEYGETLWNGDALPDTIAGEHGEQLEALQVVVSPWTVRDIRFHLLPRILEDAKRALSERNRANRVRALDDFANALTLATFYDDEGEPEDVVSYRPIDALAELLEALPSGADRLLVEDAVRLDAHVFLTQDKAVLRQRDLAARGGLLIASPQDLLEDLAACGALHCLLDPRRLTWPIPDLQRVTHLISALPSNRAG